VQYSNCDVILRSITENALPPIALLISKQKQT